MNGASQLSDALNIRWLSRRLDELQLPSRLRRLSTTKRALLFVGSAVFLLYVLLGALSGETTVGPTAKRCVVDRLRHYERGAEESNVLVGDNAVPFVGNGWLGLGLDVRGELRLADGREAHGLGVSLGWRPLADTLIDEAVDEETERLVDLRTGRAMRVRCFLIDEECACVIDTVYAHRTRPNLLIHTFQVINPTRSAITVQLKRQEPDASWERAANVGSTAVHVRSLRERAAAAVICSALPDQLTVQQKREESLRVTCAVERWPQAPAIWTSSSSSGPATSPDVAESKRKAQELAIKAFATAASQGTAALDASHDAAWRKLNAVHFGLSHSKAPNVLNAGLVNGTRYALLSSVRAPALEEDLSKEQKETATRYLTATELCYTGHPTLLFPSRLWQQTGDSGHPGPTASDAGASRSGGTASGDQATFANWQRLVDVWLLTLEKRGCSKLLKSGAEGLGQALILSLLGASFQHSHLELNADPAELHRELEVEGLRVPGSEGKLNATLALRLRLDTENRPFLEAKASSPQALYVCGAGCLSEPVELPTDNWKRVDIKVTRPLTSILYVADSRRHLEQLRSTIHVAEVVEAPAHEHELIALHRHGSRIGGLPTIFWVVLGLLLVAFHAFLIKLLWTEWRKGDTVPYNPYLRSRYSNLRKN